MAKGKEEKAAAVAEPIQEKAEAEAPAAGPGTAVETAPDSGEGSCAPQPDQAPASNQKTKAKEIKKVVNQQVQKLIQIYMNREQNENEGPSSLSFCDPTEALPGRPVQILDLEMEDQDRLVETLESRRAVVVSSFDLETSIAGAYAVVRDRRFAAYEKRTLVLGSDKNKKRTDLSIGLFTRQEYRDRTRQIVLVEIDREGDFLDSVKGASPIYAETIRESLKERDTLLLCSVRSQLLDLAPEQCLSDDFPLCHWTVPFLPHALRRYFAAARATELSALLLDQRKSGLWPADVGDFYHDLSLHLRKGRLEAEVQRRQALIREPTGSSVAENLERVAPEEVFRSDKEVHGAVVYTATYFQDLTPNDFDRIVRLVLAGRTYTLEEELQVVTEQGTVQTLKKKVERKLVDLWQESSDRILRECHLEAIPLASAMQVVDFTAGHLRRELKAFLETRYPMFLSQSFRRLQEVGILFAPDASGAIVDNLIRLSVERTVSDPAYYSRDWLVNFVVSLRVHLDTDPAPEDPSEQLLFLLSKIQNDRLRWHFFDRLAQLIREMLDYSELHKTVHGFLDQLLAYREHDAALYILLELIKRLRFSAQFDALSWIKRMLDQGGPEIRQKTYQCLMSIAVESGPHIFEFLEALRGWLPVADREPVRYSPSNRSALLFLPHYCFRTISSFLPKHRGEWPSRYDLLSFCFFEPEQLRSKLDLLACWLVHPGMATVLTVGDLGTEEMTLSPLADLVEHWLSSALPVPELFLDSESLEIELLAMLDFEPEQLPVTLVADLLEQWLWILEGTDPADAGSEARRLADALLSAFAERADHRQKKALERRWLCNQQRYCEEINRLPVRHREKRGELQVKRKKVIELRHRFAEIGARRPEPESGRHS